MYMGDDYYQRKIEGYERDRAKAALAMNVCVSYITFKNDREKRKITDSIYLLQNVDMTKAQKGRKKIQDVVKKLKSTGYVSIFDVEKSLDERQRKFRLDLDYSERHRIADDISEDPVAALSDYSRRYMEAKQAVLRVQKEQAEALKEEAERKKQEKLAESRRESYDPLDSSRNYFGDIEEEPKRVRPRPYSATTAEASRELIKEDIDKRIASKYGTVGFTYEERDRIIELYPEIAYYSDTYYSIDTLEKGIEIANISTKDKILAEDMMRLGMYTFEVMTRELLSDRVIDKGNELFRHINIGKSLEKYKESYQKFMKYYSSLDASKKEAIDNTIANNRLYNNMFGKYIATPAVVTLKINNYVSDYIVKNRYTFYDHYNGRDYYSKTMHATRFMNIEQIASLYKRLKYETERYGVYGRDDEETKQLLESRREDLAKLQRDFASVILTKLETYNKTKDIFSMSEEERKEYYEMRNEKLAAVIAEVFNEEPMAQELLRDLDEKDLKDKGKALVGTYEAKKSTAERVYGIGKLKKAMAQISGKWSRYTMLMEKEELTEEEQKEIVSMFS